MKRLILSFAALALLTGGAGPVNAAVVYDNGPINGTVEAWTINYGYQVTDSFTVSSPTTLTGAQIGLWAYPGDNPTSVEWSIGSAPYGSNISSGTSSLSSTFTGGYGFGIYPLFESTFSLTGVLSTGTYWFTLQNAASINGDPVYWDQNNGPSTAFESIEGSIPSESFQLYSGTTVPEPSTVTLLGIGVVGLVGYTWRRRKSATA